MNLISFNDKEIAISRKNKNFFKQKNCFYIGEWCLSKKNFFNKNLFLNTYKYKKQYKKNSEYLYFDSIYKLVLENLSKSLNKYHRQKYTKEYWEILIYRWLWNYIFNLHARWEVAKKIIKNYPVETVYDLNFDNKSFIPDSTIHSRDIMGTAGNNYWNHQIFINIFKSEHAEDIKIKKLIINKKFDIKNVVLSLSKSLEYSNIFNYTVNRSNFFYDIRLKNKFIFLLKNLNKFFFKIKVNKKYIRLERNNNRKNFYLFKKSSDKFINFLNNSLEWNFPRIFLENYYQLEESYTKLNWPKKPKYICSELAHNFDEVYKIYLAKKKISGSKIYFLQHGYGGIFSNNNYYNIFYEKKISDKYFAWGSNLNEKKVTNTRIQWLDSSKKNSYKFSVKKEILIELYDFNESPFRTPNGYIGAYDRKINIINMIDNLFFNLNKDIKKIINFKILNLSNKKLIEESIKLKFLNVKFLNTKKLSYNLSNRFNLQIHFFLGGGFFETMHLNLPIILVYNEKFIDKLDSNFKKKIQELEDVNIVFKDPIKASQFINKNYSDIKKWWFDKKLQNVRKKFVYRYCDSGVDLFKDIK